MPFFFSFYPNYAFTRRCFSTCSVSLQRDLLSVWIDLCLYVDLWMFASPNSLSASSGVLNSLRTQHVLSVLGTHVSVLLHAQTAARVHACCACTRMYKYVDTYVALHVQVQQRSQATCSVWTAPTCLRFCKQMCTSPCAYTCSCKRQIDTRVLSFSPPFSGSVEAGLRS